MLKNCMPRLNRRRRSHLAEVLPLGKVPPRQLPLGVPVARPQNSLWGGHKQLILTA
jgi:hypothetical protein